MHRARRSGGRPLTVPLAHFERLYRQAEDPWDFAGRWYEERKRSILLASLPQARFGSAYEPACSVGVLTRELARRCDGVLAADASTMALERASRRLSGLANVRLERHQLPADWPRSQLFDLVVASELMYYFCDDDLRQVAGDAVAAVAPGGCLVSVHWRHPVAEHVRSGDAVEQVLADRAAGTLERTVRHLEEDFVLSVHVRRNADDKPGRVSVARRTGLC